MHSLQTVHKKQYTAHTIASEDSKQLDLAYINALSLHENKIFLNDTGFLPGSFFDPEDEGDMCLRNIS
jgi:hypothetical protein